MEKQLADILKPSTKLLPIPGDIDTCGSPLTGIKAVVFDIYGTLLISGSGDVGTAMESGSAEAFQIALQKAGVPEVPKRAAEAVKQRFFSLINKQHEAMKSQGYPYPEVDIIRIWTDIISSPDIQDSLPQIKHVESSIIAALYETSVNPVYPMPNTFKLLKTLSKKGFKLGIVSNAQFYTSIIFDSIIDGGFTSLGFEKTLCLFSYEEKRSKPDTKLFTTLTDRLADFNISPGESLFVGNDMLKDIMPSAVSGYKTALFAGDRRSLRLRKDHDACRNIRPDVIVNSLIELLDYIQEG